MSARVTTWPGPEFLSPSSINGANDGGFDDFVEAEEVLVESLLRREGPAMVRYLNLAGSGDDDSPLPDDEEILQPQPLWLSVL